MEENQGPPRPYSEQLFGVSTYAGFVEAEFRMRPIRLDVDGYPPGWFQSLPYDEQVAVRARAMMANAAETKYRVANKDPEAAMNNPHLRLEREELDKICRLPGVESVLSEMFLNFFEIRRINGRNALVLKEGAEGFLNKFEQFRQNRIKDLLERGIVENEVDAKAAVAMVWNLMYLGNVFESADYRRKIKPNPYVIGEQVRAVFHPLRKLRAKVLKEKEEEQGTEEGWGGPLGTWLAERVAHDRKFRREFKEGRIKPMPVTLMASLFDVIRLSDRRTLAEALAAGETINWYDPEIPVELFGVQGDLWDSALKAYFILTGKNPIDPQRPGVWAGQLADIVSKMRLTQAKLGKDERRRDFGLRMDYDRPDFYLWAICSSVGLRYYGSELRLALPAGVDEDAFIQKLLTPRLADKQTRDYLRVALQSGTGAGIVRAVDDWKRSFGRTFER